MWSAAPPLGAPRCRRRPSGPRRLLRWTPQPPSRRGMVDQGGRGRYERRERLRLRPAPRPAQLRREIQARAPPQDDLLRGGCPARSRGGRCGGHGGVLRLVRLPAVLGRLGNAKEALTAPEEGAPYYAALRRSRQEHGLPPHLTRPISPCASTRAPARLRSSRCRPRCPWSFPTASATPSATPRRLAATRSFSGPPVRCSGFSSPTLRPPMPRASPPWLIWWEACRWSCPRSGRPPGRHPRAGRRLPDA